MFKGVKDRPIMSLSDEELIQGFFATWENSDKLSAIIDELTIRMPDLPILAKASLLPQIQKAKTKQQLVEAINANIGQALKLNPDDKELHALSMFVEVENNIPNLKEKLREYSKQHKDSGLGLYFEAIMNWRQKNRNMTIKLLNEAVKREPKNTIYSSSLENVKTKKYGDHVFALELMFDPKEF